MVRALLAYKRGEPRVCAMVRAATPQEEDRRRVCRERTGPRPHPTRPRDEERQPTSRAAKSAIEAEVAIGFVLQIDGTVSRFPPRATGSPPTLSWILHSVQAGSRVSTGITCGLDVDPVSPGSRRDRACGRCFVSSHPHYLFSVAASVAAIGAAALASANSNARLST